MSVAVAEFIVWSLGWYLAYGAAFAVLFLWRWVGRIDPLAQHGTIGFRVLVFPGVAMLWPLFIVRLLAGMTEPPEEWTAHRAAARRAVAPRAVEVLR